MSASLSVVIPSLNGADGVERCLRALRGQTIWSELEIIVVDDGSTDGTRRVAAAGGAIVVRHPIRRGVSAARNSGIAAASAPYVAFIDDDCEPRPEWAEQLIAAYDASVVGVGGSIVAATEPGIIPGYLARHNPLNPQEQDLARSDSVPYRFWLYLRKQWTAQQHCGRREVVSLPAANLSVRRQALVDVGGFDERIRFGSEDEDLCYRLRHRFSNSCLIFEPDAIVTHYFRPSLRDTMRRSRLYGRGSALMYRKWPQVPPTVFPFPVVVVAALISSAWFPLWLPVVAAVPHALYPQGIRATGRGRGIACMLDAYLQLIQEACDDVGFVQGLWEFRNFASEPLSDTVHSLTSDDEAFGGW
ncbi:MAG TPA: glycosyltransferase [Streptosporangiaceae bacterium]|nr:glycosyltransferase [Streptosporangiaceae bacterium]